MSVPRQSFFEGEIWVSHKASPGLTEEQARVFGYEPADCKEGKVFEAAILTCSHCDQRLIRNPFRERERATCLHCSNHYICDVCDWKRRQPGYVHRPFQAVKESILEGKVRPEPESNQGLLNWRFRSPLTR